MIYELLFKKKPETKEESQALASKMMELANDEDIKALYLGIDFEFLYQITSKPDDFVDQIKKEV